MSNRRIKNPVELTQTKTLLEAWVVVIMEKGIVELAYQTTLPPGVYQIRPDPLWVKEGMQRKGYYVVWYINEINITPEEIENLSNGEIRKLGHFVNIIRDRVNSTKYPVLVLDKALVDSRSRPIRS